MPIVKGKKRAYPLGGLGLDAQEEDQLENVLREKGVSLKLFLRFLVRKFLRGEIEVKIGK